MSDESPKALDPFLFAEGPARDQRFTVAARWVECANFPEGDPLRAIEFLHRQMNEEVDSLECSAASLRDFPDAAWHLRMSLARQCWDEARHAAMFRRIFEERGGRVGQYPVLNFQYRIITHIRSLVGRLAIQNRSFEAGGLDAIASGIEQARRDGDQQLAELFEAQAPTRSGTCASRTSSSTQRPGRAPAACWTWGSRLPRRRRHSARSWAQRAPRA